MELLEYRRLLYSQPVANNDSALTPDDTLAAIDVLANDTDPNTGGTLAPSTVTVVTGPSDGSASPNPATGLVTYTPNTGFTGTDQFTYTFADNYGVTSNLATVTIQVFKPTAPFANNDNEVTPGNTPIAIDVLANDTDPNPGGMLVPLTVTVATSPKDGSTSLNTTTGAITYTPSTGFTGTDRFTYTVADNFGQTSNAATVTIQVAPAADLQPVANADMVTTPGDTAIAIDVLANDSDPNSGGMLNPASVNVSTPPSDGSTMLNTATGAITYTPNYGFTGTDTFEYTVSDNFGETSKPATVTIVVTASLPIAKNISVITPVNTPVLINIFANATDPNSAGVLDPTKVAVTSGPSDSDMLAPPSFNKTTGAITYTPKPGFSGTDEFMYTVTDNFGLTSIPAMVTIQVTSAITATGLRFNAVPGLPLNKIPIAAFTDLNLYTPPAQPTGYMATINWGNGLTSSGTVSEPNSANVFTVSTSFTYPAGLTAQFVPGTALPVTVTIMDSNVDVGTAISSAVLLSTGQNVAFTGSLAPVAGNGPNAANGVTDTTEPTFSGTAPPFFVVQLYASGAPSAPAIAPAVTADAAGYWSVGASTVRPTGTNTIYGTVSIPGSFLSAPVLLTSITVTTPAPTLSIQATLTGTGEMSVLFVGVTSSTGTASLLKTKAYTLSGPGLRAFHPKAVTRLTSSTLAAGELEVVLKIPRRILRHVKVIKVAGTEGVVER